jgi:hypothetical protein
MAEEQKSCASCNASFIITDTDREFYGRQKVASPTWCPHCRMLRRFMWRNEHNLFRRKDDQSGKDIFSIFPKEVKGKVYDIHTCNGDDWDPMKYGRDFDPNRPFLDQLKDLLNDVPWPSKAIQRMVNSDYCDQADDMKNSYLCFNGGVVEDSGYTIGSSNIKDSFDLYECRGSELSYDNYMIDDSYQVFYSINSEECRNIWFSNYLIGCSDCFSCVNLRNKQYHIFNEPHTKEDYQKFMQGLETGSQKVIEEYKKKAHDFWKKFPMKFTLTFRNQNSTGEHIEHSKNVKESYCVHGGENMKFCQSIESPASDSYDYTVWGVNAIEIYESVTCGDGCSRIKSSFDCWPSCSDLEYCLFCRGSSNLFGCVGIKKKQYCILNKQYSKEDYEALREKIIKQIKEKPFEDKYGHVYNYGDFLPIEFSPYAYNETIAQDFFPLTKEEAGKKGYVWREREKRTFEATLKARDISDNIKDVTDDILKQVIECRSCSEPYRLIKPEFEFLKSKNLPIPRLCPECRFRERFQFVNTPELRPAKCQCAGVKDDRGIYQNSAQHFHEDNHCPNEFNTSFRKGADNIIYCEQCYQTEVV